MSLDDTYRHPQMDVGYVRRLIQTGGQYLLDLYAGNAEGGLILLLNQLAIQNKLMANWREYRGTPQLVPQFSIFANGMHIKYTNGWYKNYNLDGVIPSALLRPILGDEAFHQLISHYQQPEGQNEILSLQSLTIQ